MFCTRCGNTVSEDDRFCRKCGAQLTPPQTPGESPQCERRTVKSNSSKERRTAPPENEKMKIILPLAILTVVLFSFIIVLIVLLNRPEPEPAPRTSSGISSVESAAVEPETETTTEEPTTETTTEPPTEADKVLIQDLASFSEGEITAQPAAVSEDSTSVVYSPSETDGDMYYYVYEWMEYLRKDSKLTYVGSSGSDVLYTAYYNCSDNSIEKKKAKVDGKTKKQEYVLSLVVVNDPNTNAVLSVTANMAKGLNISDLDYRFTGESVSTTSTAATTTTSKKTTASTSAKKANTRTTSAKATTTTEAVQQSLTPTYLQDLADYSDRRITADKSEGNNGMTVVTYSGSESDMTDIVNVWLDELFHEYDFEYIGMNESDGHIVYYFDYDSGQKDKPKARLENDESKEYSLEVDCGYKNSESINKVIVKACKGIKIVDMGERF